jgi:hypothetical protein
VDRDQPRAPADLGDGDLGDPTEAQLEALRNQLAATPASAVIATNCMQMFELAALHLSLQPPQLDQASVAIDALGAVVEGLVGRLGEDEPTLREALAQLRLAFVQVSAIAGEPAGSPEPGGG